MRRFPVPNYRQLHEDSLKTNRPAVYEELRRSGELPQYLDGVRDDANRLYQRLLKQLAEKNPYHPADWKNSREAWEGALERSAQEFVLHDRILVPDPETERAMRDGYTD